MTVARRDAHQIAMIAAPVPQTIKAVTSPGEPLSKVKTPSPEFLLALFVRARWQIDLRRRSKWTENDCFDEI
jgi:hypothetical protein